MPEKTTLLLPHEIARVLKVSVAWVRSHSSPGAKCRMPVKKVGQYLRYDLDEVMEWIGRRGRGGEGNDQ